MPKLKISFLAILSGLTLASLHAQSVPPLVNYQGRLASPDGSPLPTADYELSFRIYDAATNGLLVWGPQVFDGAAAQGHCARIPVVQGYFNVILGPADTNGVSLANAFTNSSSYVEVAVGNRPPILPRQQILATPFALQAANGVLPGTIVAFGGSTNRVLEGWLLCDGRAVSSGKYPRLFSMISTDWGAGVPATTNDFNLPDLRGLFLRGADLDSGRDPDNGARTSIRAGGNAGNAVGSYQADAFAQHLHNLQGLVIRQGTEINPLASFGFIVNLDQPPFIPTTATGGSSETRPKNAYVHYIIKY